MKLHILLAAVPFIGAGQAMAQGPAYGIKGGLNIASLAVNEADEEQTRLGVNAGVFFRTMPEEPIGLQVELLYSGKGSSTTYSGLFGLVDQEVDLNLNYLELPILASFRVGGIVDLQVGGYAAYLLNAQVSTSGDLGAASEELDRDNFASMDFGLGGGVGFNLGPAQVGVRYLHGLVDVADQDAAEALLGDAQNRCFQAYLAVGLPGSGQ
ncbi:MAG: porin family protein [Flavobacteriales bacterium]